MCRALSSIPEREVWEEEREMGEEGRRGLCLFLGLCFLSMKTTGVENNYDFFYSHPKFMATFDF
jgi:hypothetical protein